MIVLGGFVMAIGALLIAIGGIGVARLKTTLARTHAASKPASLGMVLVTLGAGMTARSWGLVGIALVMGAFQFATAPIAGHLVDGLCPTSTPNRSSLEAPRLKGSAEPFSLSKPQFSG